MVGRQGQMTLMGKRHTLTVAAVTLVILLPLNYAWWSILGLIP